MKKWFYVEISSFGGLLVSGGVFADSPKSALRDFINGECVLPCLRRVGCSFSDFRRDRIGDRFSHGVCFCAGARRRFVACVRGA